MKLLELYECHCINCEKIVSIATFGNDEIKIYNDNDEIKIYSDAYPNSYAIQDDLLNSQELYKELVNFLTCYESNFYSIPEYIERQQKLT